MFFFNFIKELLGELDEFGIFQDEQLFKLSLREIIGFESDGGDLSSIKFEGVNGIVVIVVIQ